MLQPPNPIQKRGPSIDAAALDNHARFVAEYGRRMAAIYEATPSARKAMADNLRADMAAGTLLAPVTVLSPTRVAA